MNRLQTILTALAAVLILVTLVSQHYAIPTLLSVLSTMSLTAQLRCSKFFGLNAKSKGATQCFVFYPEDVRPF